MSLKITDRTYEELYNTITEAERLSSIDNPTQQQRSKINVLLAKVSLLKQGIDPTQLKRAEEERLLKSAGLMRRPDMPTSAVDIETEREWRHWIRGGEVRLTMRPEDAEVRAVQLEAGTQSIVDTQGAAGGYFVPPNFYSDLYKVMRQANQIFDARFSTIVETPKASAMPFPAIDDTANISVLVSETTQSAQSVPVADTLQLKSYTFRSQIIPLTVELLEDERWPVSEVLTHCFGMRHALGVGNYLITGNGVNQPAGLVASAVAAGCPQTIMVGSSANDGSANTGSNSVGTGDLVNCYKQLGLPYRPFSAWYMNDTTAQFIAGILDKYGRPILPIEQGVDGQTLLSRPICICPSISNIAPASTPIILASTKHFIQRRVTTPFLRRFMQLPGYVENGIVGFESWLRCDASFYSPSQTYPSASILQSHS